MGKKKGKAFLATQKRLSQQAQELLAVRQAIHDHAINLLKQDDQDYLILDTDSKTWKAVGGRFNILAEIGADVAKQLEHKVIIDTVECCGDLIQIVCKPHIPEQDRHALAMKHVGFEPPEKMLKISL